MFPKSLKFLIVYSYHQHLKYIIKNNTKFAELHVGPHFIRIVRLFISY